MSIFFEDPSRSPHFLRFLIAIRFSQHSDAKPCRLVGIGKNIERTLSKPPGEGLFGISLEREVFSGD
jgi:hypothetical protein